MTHFSHPEENMIINNLEERHILVLDNDRGFGQFLIGKSIKYHL